MNDLIDIENLSQSISFEDALQLAVRLHQANQFEYAEDVYQKLLEISPENPNLLHFFGLLKHQRGFAEDGADYIKKALELVPDYIDAHNNLGNLYLQVGQPDLAEPCFRRVIALNPDFVPVYGNLGIALKQLQQFNEAIEYLLKAIALEPTDAYHYQNIGNVYKDMRQYREAVGAYRKSLALEPFNAEAYRRLSITFYIMGEIDNCIDVVTQWLEYDPENPTAKHLHAAYTHTNIPSRASDDYVRQIFDGFAASFDGVLKRLEYRAPFLVEQALNRLKPKSDNWRLLDAGCGTGLCGALVRPLVKHLAGVDLSSKMLEKAQVRGVYDKLFESELTEFFLKSQSDYDVITCVDTLCYFGDLTDVAVTAISALKSKGWFIFTLETWGNGDDSTENFHLNLHGRYSHKEQYVRNVLSDAGFLIQDIENAVLRREGRDQVAGMVVTAQCP